MSGVVTGDAVVLGLQPARVPSRALAVFLDLTVLWTVYLLLTLALSTAVGGLDEAAQAAVAVALFVLVLLGGPVAVETLSNGRSLGKLACGLRVVREDGGPIRFRHALVRGTIGLVEIQLTVGVVACVASLVSARGRRLGDVFGGTLVVRERTAASQPGAPLPPPPPWLAGHFAPLDLSAVPDSLWLAVRQYVLRGAQLDPQVSASMAQQLAGDVSARTGVPVPVGMPAQTYLMGVLAERQGRDARRAFGPQAGQPFQAGGYRSGAVGGGAPHAGGSYTSPPGHVPPAAAPSAAPAVPDPAPEDTAPGPRRSDDRPRGGFAPPG